MQNKPSFFLIDDSRIDLFITKKFLQRHRVSDAIRLFENPTEALAAIESKENLPDIILLDIKMPELDGFQAAVSIRARYPQVKILVLSMHNDRSYIERMYELGVAGYVLKTADIDEIIEAIHKVALGGSYFTPDIILSAMNRSSDQSGEIKLTRRERQVIELIAKENSNIQIAEILNLSVGTINSYRKNLLKKLNVKNTAGLVRFAMNHGIINS
jgi:DNA-binding NarL/FixJ family response regulator